MVLLEKQEQRYCEWLINKVNTPRDYSILLRGLYSIEFYSLLQYDEDRGHDGLALREEWADIVKYSGSLDFGVANVLEVLIGISRRIEFQLFGTKYYDSWNDVRIFWDLINNLGLSEMYGEYACDAFDEISEIVTLFLNRKYICHKKCNIFVLDYDPRDLRKLNIWTQMGLYIREKWPS